MKPFDPVTVTNKTIHVTVGYYFQRTVTNERRPNNHSDDFCVSFGSVLLDGNQSDDAGIIFYHCPKTVTNQTIPATQYDPPFPTNSNQSDDFWNTFSSLPS